MGSDSSQAIVTHRMAARAGEMGREGPPPKEWLARMNRETTVTACGAIRWMASRPSA